MRRWGWVLVFLSLLLAGEVKGTSIPMVSTIGEARVVLESNDRAAAFKKAIREALIDAVKKEAALLVENPEDLSSLEGEIETRLKDFVVKYRVLEARFLGPETQTQNSQEGEEPASEGEYGVWEVKVKAFIDSDLLQRSIMGSEQPIEGG